MALRTAMATTTTVRTTNVLTPMVQKFMRTSRAHFTAVRAEKTGVVLCEQRVTTVANDLGNLSPVSQAEHNIYLAVCIRPLVARNRFMMEIPSTGIVLVLAALAVALLALVAMLFPRKPKRAEKWEKAEIMKQLLALSEREESMRRAAASSASPVSVRMRASGAARTATRPATSPLKATAKAAIPARSKAR